MTRKIAKCANCKRTNTFVESEAGELCAVCEAKSVRVELEAKPRSHKGKNKK